MNKLLDFAESIGLGINWETTSSDSLKATLKSSNDFSAAFSKISNISGAEEITEDGHIDLSGSSFAWNIFEDDSEVPSYYIELIGDYINDTYEVTVWQK